MLRDVFYYGSKPNVHPREKFATSLEDARKQCTTEHFWIINEYCDYQNFNWDFDFEFLLDEDVWAEEHNNVWPSQHQKDSGTWLCASRFSDVIIYRADVNPIKRKNIKNSNWVLLDLIDETKFDFSWHPDPTDPPYIYIWGCKYFPVELQACLEYHVLDASTIKYMTDTVELLPQLDRWVTPSNIDDTNFDYSWRPDPLEPALIWQFSSQWQKTGGPSYVMPNATEVKYITFQKVKVLANKSKWTIPDNIDSSSFDFSWHPDDTSPPYIYRFPTQWAMSGGPTYTVEGATEIKYVDVLTAKAIVDKANWIVPSTIDSDSFDFSWHPYVEDEPYIYQFGTQWQKTGGPKYITPGTHANSQVKYIDTRIIKAKRLVVKDAFNILDNNVIDNFDYSWHPDETEEPFIYVFGNNQYSAEVMPTIEYVVTGATQIKYVNDIIAILGPDRTNWLIVQPIYEDKFDFRWKPNPKDPPYIYVWGNTYIDGKIKSTIEYHVDGATEKKYIDELVEAAPEWDRWNIPENIDITKFDFTWRPDPLDADFIWQFGTQHQKTGGPKYTIPGATEIKYVDFQKAKALINNSNWTIPNNIDSDSFDFSWHPDDTSPPYVYQFGTQWAMSGGPVYPIEGATEIKYVDTIVAKAIPNKTYWDFDPNIIDSDSFDFSWHPYVEDEPYIYQFGTQWQKTGGPRYITPGTHKNSPVKYIDTRIIKATRLSNKKNWRTINEYVIEDFDYSWHPDETDDLYVYMFGNNQYPAEIMPTIQYIPDNSVRLASSTVIGQIKYVNDTVAILGENKSSWLIPDNVDTTNFDFSWVPHPAESPYIYQFGTQWQKTGGPRYVISGATEIKYVDIQKVKILPSEKNWSLPENIDSSSFDFSWHPDDTSPPYIYRFPTQWAISGGPIYTVEGATEVKYVDVLTAKAIVNKTNWIVPSTIDNDSFDFSWHPYLEDAPYIYVFGTQHQKTGGPKYITPGTHANSPVKYIDTRIIKSKRLEVKEAFTVLDNNVVVDFDYSWHPDDTEQPYIYQFGNNQYPAEIMPTIEYVVAGATQIKYVTDLIATLGENKSNWKIPDNIDVTGFDFSWVPNPKNPKYIYQYGTQWQKTGGPRYIVPNASEVKYIDTQKVKILPLEKNWTIPNNVYVAAFDLSWHPDDTSPPYIYQFGTQWAMSGGPRYIVYGATEVKYIDVMIAKAIPNKDNWEYDPSIIDIASFDFSWHPYVEDEPYIYQFGTQWQKTGGPRYIAPDSDANSPVKYIDTRIIKAKRLPASNKNKFAILDNNVVVDFDYSWHPDDTEQPYIYHFGNSQYPAEIMPTIEYVVEGATEVKYINKIVAKLGENKSAWMIPDNIDITDFDFSWVPNPKDPKYIYEFGTQWQKTGGPKYIVPGASEVKYVDTQKVKISPNKNNFNILDNLEIADFDYSWHPDTTEEPFIYVFGNSQYPAEIMPTIEYVVEGATQIKYVNDIVAKLSPNRTNWTIPENVDVTNFDFSWVPNPKDPAYIYEFGTQWQKTGGPKYIVPGASEVNYVDTHIVKISPNKSKFNNLNNNVAEFDYSWHPDSTEPPYIYHFGNSQYPAEIMPTIEYVVEGATQVKYINDIVAKLSPNRTNWKIIKPINEDKFDFSWIPNPKDPPYIYVFGNQWHSAVRMPTVEYVVPKATEKKYIDTFTASLSQSLINWDIPENIDVTSFDFSWVPDAYDDPYIYVFGTQWQTTGGPKYVVKGATETKYIDLIKAKRLSSMKYWVNPNQSDINKFDFSWHPYENAPPYIYQFGTLLDKEDGPRYVSPNTNDEIVYLKRVQIVGDEIPTVENFSKYVITTTLEDLINQHPNELFWALNPDLDYSEFDFDWRPDIEQSQYLHAFGSQDSINTQTYFVNASSWLKGFKEINYVEDKTIDVKINIDMFFVDRSNSESQARFEKIKIKFPNIQKTRYLNSWVDTINRCINRASSNLCWILNSELDYSNFDFNYYPNPWQMKMVQVFGTQWSHWGTTFMVNRETFAQDTKYIKIIEHLSNLNFVKDRKAKATNILYDIVYIDHGNVDTSTLAGNTVIKYQNSYITTFQKLLAILPVKKEHYVWIASTVCDYKEFDFTYICDPFAKEQLHVFPSDRQKFGDTFLVDVNKLRSLIEDMNVLEDYEKINYNQSQRAKRLPAPIIITENDTHVSTIDSDFDFPYATFLTIDNKEIQVVDTEPMSLWSPESKNIQITSVGGTRIVVPKEAKEYVKRELYDYPYIITNSKLAKSSPMDIVFLSNGETGAEDNYQHLLKVTKELPNRVARVDGVNGRVQAYHAAAEASNTPWMFTVFAKLKVSNKFDWNWQPDRLQLPKHYVFHASNPVNGLKYGHMAMIAYNKKLTLANTGKGLDFTMDDEHEVVELNSGIANFNTDAWSTWRTSFREALKLRAENSEISRNRLEMWLTVGMGKFNEYSTDGAQHAVEYFEEVNGDFDKLKLSYDWPWLHAYFEAKYK